MSDMNDVDRLVQRAVAGITSIAARAARFSTRLLLMTLVLCVGGFALGVAALSGGIETVWIVLGIVFGTIAIASAVLARWRVGSVKRHAPELAAALGLRAVAARAVGLRHQLPLVETGGWSIEEVHDDVGRVGVGRLPDFPGCYP